jgi:MFS family permease
MFTDFGAGIGPFILGILIPFVGYRYLYILMGVLVIIALIGYYFLHGKTAKNNREY